MITHIAAHLVMSALSLVSVQQADVAGDEEVVTLQDRDRLAEIVDFVWAGYRNNLERLERGVFSAKGVFRDNEPNSGELTGDYSIYYAVDYPQQLLRFDVVKPFRRGTSRTAGIPSSTWEKGVKSGKFIRTLNETVFWVDGSDQVLLDDPQEKDAPIEDPFDVRVLGIAYWNDIERGLGWNDVSGFFAERPAQKAVIKDRLYEITYVQNYKGTNKIKVVHAVWFDASKGFAPIAYELRYGTGGESPDQEDPPSETCSLTWKEFSMEDSAVWLPITYEHETRDAPRSGGRVRSKRLNFDWHTVNGNLDPKLFTIQGLELPPNTRVMDLRLKEPIVVGTIGDPDKFVRDKTVSSSAIRWPLALVVFITVNTIFISIYVGSMLRKRKVTKSQEGEDGGTNK